MYYFLLLLLVFKVWDDVYKEKLTEYQYLFSMKNVLGRLQNGGM
jgi:hypothetical protein